MKTSRSAVGLILGFLSEVCPSPHADVLDTCAQAALTDLHTLIRPLHGLPEREISDSGSALGYADPHALENKFVTERAALAQFATFAVCKG